jgi:predicted component of type VI protein secretion system
MLMMLTVIDGPQTGAARAIDGAAPFVIGTEFGASWVLPGTGPRAGITMRSGRDGFVAEATGDVTIDGHPVADGQHARIGHGCQIGIGGVTIKAALREETPVNVDPSGRTISAILSDVAPGGADAQGLLPGRSGEDWLDGVTQGRKPKPTRDWAEVRAFATRTEPLPINADLITAPAGAKLPADWDLPGDRQNQMYQATAASTALSIGRQIGPSDDTAADPAQSAGLTTLLTAIGLVPDETDGPPALQLANAGAALRILLEGLARLDSGTPRLAVNDQLASLLSDRDGLAQSALLARLSALETRQQAVIDAAHTCLAAAKAALDPDTITAQVRSQNGLSGRLSPNRAAWAAYLQSWTDTAQGPAFLLSEQALDRAISARLTQFPAQEPAP